MTSQERAKERLKAASSQANLDAAIAWFVEGHPILDDHSAQEVMAALIAILEEAPNAGEALRRVASVAASSDIDPTAVLFEIDTIADITLIRRCLDALAFKSPTRTLVGLTVESVNLALHEEPSCIDTLALIAGLTSKELRRRLGIRGASGTEWTPRQVKEALSLIDSIISGTISTPVTGAVPLRPVELVLTEGAPLTGWPLVEKMRTTGVPFEVLLAQRAVGGSWGLHRNATSSKLGAAVTGLLCDELDELGTNYLRSRSSGGSDDLSKVSPLGNFATLMTVAGDGSPWWSVVVSVANDSGTASKTAARLMDTVQACNTAILVAGPGWFDRATETAELATAVGGQLYSEKDVKTLASMISTSPNTEAD
jgi:hypothetical protein